MAAIIQTTNLKGGVLIQKIESLRMRARLLTGLRQTLGLKPQQDIRRVQWNILESQLAAESNRIQQRLRLVADQYMSESQNVQVRAVFMHQLGEIELELNRSYTFYDTYMDILTQRLSEHIGPQLRGCDAIAADGLRKGFLADITMPPLVYCDRGFGASTLREGVRLSNQPPNPLPFIAIPYARIDEKYNLISIYHEVGHQALVKLNLVPVLQQVFQDAMQKAGATPLLRQLFGNWSKELGPDFWAFAHTGMAQTASIRDVLVLPQPMMFQVAPYHPHPPAYLRFLASVAWCRHLWGKGQWDDWEAEWVDSFPIPKQDKSMREAILSARKLLPVAARAMLNTRFKKLNGKPLLSLFDVNTIAPRALEALATEQQVSDPGFKKQPIGVQLAAFRLLRDNRGMRLAPLNQLMHQWLIRLGNH